MLEIPSVLVAVIPIQKNSLDSPLKVIYPEKGACTSLVQAPFWDIKSKIANIVNKKLSKTALSLIRKEQKIEKGKDIKLKGIKFLSLFQIRQMLRERKTACTNQNIWLQSKGSKEALFKWKYLCDCTWCCSWYSGYKVYS